MDGCWLVYHSYQRKRKNNNKFYEVKNMSYETKSQKLVNYIVDILCVLFVIMFVYVFICVVEVNIKFAFDDISNYNLFKIILLQYK